MKPLIVTSGEPAGIGPEICLELADLDYPLVVIGDKYFLEHTANCLNKKVQFLDYVHGMSIDVQPEQLYIYHIPCATQPRAGVLDTDNSQYVIDMLTIATDACLNGEFGAMVTAPIQKSILNKPGQPFSGHTEFLAKRCKVDRVVMMLANPKMRVVLVTTHVPLNAVASLITQERVIDVITILHKALRFQFGISDPKIHIAGLNPHAGEDGHMGQEEIDIIKPALKKLSSQGINVVGPVPADTMFLASTHSDVDAFVAMYHDQGLATVKYADFENTVNITLGLPIVRTSVDHGTALDIAGQGTASANSLFAAVGQAYHMALGCANGKN